MNYEARLIELALRYRSPAPLPELLRLDTLSDVLEPWEVVKAAYDIERFPPHTRGRSISAVYWLLDAAGGIAYVGQSQDVARRIHEHRRQKRDAQLAAFQPCKERLRMHAERLYICLHWPRQNRDNYGPLQAGKVRGKPGWNRGTTTLSEDQQQKALALHAEGYAFARISEVLGLGERGSQRVGRFIKTKSVSAEDHPR